MEFSSTCQRVHDLSVPAIYVSAYIPLLRKESFARLLSLDLLSFIVYIYGLTELSLRQSSQSTSP